MNVMAAEVGDIGHYRTLADAIALADPDAAQDAAAGMLALGTKAFDKLLREMEKER